MQACLMRDEDYLDETEASITGDMFLNIDGTYIEQPDAPVPQCENPDEIPF